MSNLATRARARKLASNLPRSAVICARLIGPYWLTVGRVYRRNVQVFHLRRHALPTIAGVK